MLSSWGPCTCGASELKGHPGAGWRASEPASRSLVSRVERRLTKDIGGPVPRDEAGVVAVAHSFLQDPLAKVFAEAIAGADQTVVPTVRLRESAQDSPGYQSAIRQYG